MFSFLGKRTKCDEIMNDLSQIAGLVNNKMHMTNLHSRVDIFFYIDRSIQARELCSRLKVKYDEEVDQKLAELHEQVVSRWKVDKKTLQIEPNIVL